MEDNRTQLTEETSAIELLTLLQRLLLSIVYSYVRPAATDGPGRHGEEEKGVVERQNKEEMLREGEKRKERGREKKRREEGEK